METHGLEVKTQYVRAVLRNDLGARYARIKKVPSLANTGRCLLLRQHYAKFILSKLAGSVRVINVDQSWINDTNFLRRQWRGRHQRNSSADNKV